jgi:hypothetical protein
LELHGRFLTYEQVRAKLVYAIDFAKRKSATSTVAPVNAVELEQRDALLWHSHSQRDEQAEQEQLADFIEQAEKTAKQLAEPRAAQAVRPALSKACDKKKTEVQLQKREKNPKGGDKKRKWSAGEDKKLRALVLDHTSPAGRVNWQEVALGIPYYTSQQCSEHGHNVTRNQAKAKKPKAKKPKPAAVVVAPPPLTYAGPGQSEGI